MTQLPTIQPEPDGRNLASRKSAGPKRIALHLVRILLFFCVIGLIHFQHLKLSAERQNEPFAPIEIEQLKNFFPAAHSVSDAALGDNARDVFDSDGGRLGQILQTSPGSDHIIGFSGPTNTLIAFAPDGKILGLDVLYSGDTRDHVKQVVEDQAFLESFNGMSRDEAIQLRAIDGVSGATLTSFAIAQSVINRLSDDSKKSQVSLKFPGAITLESAKSLFENATAIEPDSNHASYWHVKDADQKITGTILRTSPTADNIIGYQGPTDALIGFDPSGQVVGIAIGQSYDNQEYVGYVRNDEYFLSLLNGWDLDKLASGNVKEAEIEGVSGATMTSVPVAEGIFAAAMNHKKSIESLKQKQQNQGYSLPWSGRDFGTAIVIICGLLIGLTSLRGNKAIRVIFQLVLIGYLGLINGDLISQAMVAGWARSGIPWSNAGGLVLLTLAAFLVPMTTKRNAYCTHLCPHGAAQHLLMNRLPWKIKLPAKLTRWLKLVPALLLIWCVIVAMTSLTFSLVDIEPFDAWVFQVAGWATITIAIVGLLASMFIPMAYCRYGCPTGALLGFFRFNSKSDRWSRRDWFAVCLFAIAVGCFVLV